MRVSQCEEVRLREAEDIGGAWWKRGEEGKKFRLRSNSEQAIKDLVEGLEGYIWSVLKREDDLEQKLQQ